MKIAKKNKVRTKRMPERPRLVTYVESPVADYVMQDAGLYGMTVSDYLRALVTKMEREKITLQTLTKGAVH